MPTDPDHLKRYACFRTLTEDQRRAVAHLAKEVCYEAERVLFREGQRGTQLYMLSAGEVEVLYNIGEEGPVCVDTVGGGEILGCSTLVKPYTYTSTVRCLNEIEALVIDSAALRELMEENPSIGYEIQRQIIQLLLDRVIDLRLGM
jgi:CRP-like cAMP-binding protein